MRGMPFVCAFKRHQKGYLNPQTLHKKGNSPRMFGPATHFCLCSWRVQVLHSEKKKKKKKKKKKRRTSRRMFSSRDAATLRVFGSRLSRGQGQRGDAALHHGPGEPKPAGAPGPLTPFSVSAFWVSWFGVRRLFEVWKSQKFANFRDVPFWYISSSDGFGPERVSELKILSRNLECLEQRQ